MSSFEDALIQTHLSCDARGFVLIFLKQNSQLDLLILECVCMGNFSSEASNVLFNFSLILFFYFASAFTPGGHYFVSLYLYRTNLK